MKYENVDVEFKEVYVPDIRKDAVAFANTGGGTLYIGIADDGTVVGVEHPDEVMLQVASSLKDNISPDIMPYVSIKLIDQDEKPVVEIKVEAGVGRPYYLTAKGLKPSGVYVRKGTASQPLSEAGIRDMLIESSGKSYEKGRSLNQNLTFETFTEEMKARNLECGPSQMKTLGMIGEDGLYTNLALLLSDQCEHTIKLAIFQGTDKAVFRDRKEFTGSVLKQQKEAYAILDLLNQMKATFSKLLRYDQRDYPEEALREVLLNCVVHRDYSFSAGTLINVYTDRIEFVSLGGLVPGLSLEAIYLGVSQSRNPGLANVFYRMRLIESYGTGITKVQRLYQDKKQQPVFETTSGAFRVTLPNLNEDFTYEKMRHEETKPFVEEPAAVRYGNPQTLIYQRAKENGSITRKEVEDMLGIKTTRAYVLLNQLVEQGKLVIEGSGRRTFYVPAK